MFWQEEDHISALTVKKFSSEPTLNYKNISGSMKE